MHTCDVCATPLDGTEQDASITEAGKTYQVCSFTCKTVVYEELFPATWTWISSSVNSLSILY